MGRLKLGDKDGLIYSIKTRVNKAQYERLTGLLTQSRHRKMSELIRDIVCDKPVTIFTKDDSLNIVMAELVQIRRELNAIGNNINQVTRQLNSLKETQGKSMLILQAAQLFEQTGDTVNKLFPIISQLAKKWLQ